MSTSACVSCPELCTYMCIHVTWVLCVTAYAQLSWVSTGGLTCTHTTPLDTKGAIVLLSWSIMSSKDWPCSGGRGPITRLITQAWLLLSGVVPGHLSLLLSGKKKEESKCVKKGRVIRRNRMSKMAGECHLNLKNKHCENIIGCCISIVDMN